MGTKKAKSKARLDKFYYLAKEQGYRSRAAFKLIQLNRQYDFLSRARTVVDLCAAPGGWCQVAAKTMPVGSLIIGVDIVPIKPIRGVKTLIGDITTTQCRAAIQRTTSNALVDVVLCDGAPNVGGAWATEAYTQSALSLEALRLATDVLAPKGTFITKVFRSKDYSALVYAFKQLFNRVEATKPAASRNASAEIFVVCQGYKAPSKIDPRLLDPKHLFEDLIEPPKVAGPDALLKAKVKQKRQREGYEEGLSSAHKPLSAVEFISGDSPIEMLGQYTAITFSSKEKENIDVTKFIIGHESTSEEVKLLCGDLQVLGRSEFKQLLKWRLTVKRDLERLEKQLKKGTEKEESEEEVSEKEEEEDEEQQLLREMTELKDKIERSKKKEKKKRREMKSKARVRAAQVTQAEGIGEDNNPDELFSISKLNKKSTINRVVDKAEEFPDSDDEEEDDDEATREVHSNDDGASDSDEEKRRYEAMMDEYLEGSYRQWKARQRAKQTDGDDLDDVSDRKRKRLGEGGELHSEEEGEEDDVSGDEQSDSQDDNESDEGLVVRLDKSKAGVASSAKAAAAQWFGQDLFEDDDVLAEDDAGEPDHLQLPKKKEHSTAIQPKCTLDDDDEDDSGEDPAFGLKKPASGNDFEVVPATQSDSYSSDSQEDEFEAMNDDTKAEILALAKKMLRRKDKNDIIEAAYNRYAFHDEGLPKWFEDDERKFMRPAPHISGAEYAEARAELKAIDARPIKKVAEAKARKRKRLMNRLTVARQKAEVIANQEDVPVKSKMRDIEKLYAAAKSGGKGKKKSSRSDQYKKKGPPLDARLRKDKRGLERAAKRAKGKGKGASKGGKGRGRR